MPYLLDTCAISELAEPHPDPRVREALLAIPREEIHLSTITLGEIALGIELLPDSAQKSRLLAWFRQSVVGVFLERTLPVDVSVALRWGVLAARLQSSGQIMQANDSFIAATALHHGLTVVTGNESDFAPSGVSILNPWKQ